MRNTTFAIIAILGLSVSSAFGSATIQYTYDDAGRLLHAGYGEEAAISYAYDANGNLLQRTVASDGTVTYTLIYRAGTGGMVNGALVVTQQVAQGQSGAAVSAVVEDTGAVFGGWSDGNPDPTRTDTDVHADLDVTARFRSVGGADLDWYTARGIAPDEGEGETWADVDARPVPDKGTTLREENIADTDPENVEDTFRILAIDPGPPVVVTFRPGSPERVYTLVATDDLVSGVWSNIPGAGPRPGAGEGPGHEDALSDENEHPAGFFYRVSVDLPNGSSDPETYLDVRIELDDPSAGPPLQLNCTWEDDDLRCIASIEGGFGPTATFAWYVNGVRMAGSDSEEALFFDLMPRDRIAVVVSDGEWGWSAQWTVTDPGPTSIQALQGTSRFKGGTGGLAPLTIWPPDWADSFGEFEVVVHNEGTQDAFLTRTVSEPGVVRFEDVPEGRYDVEILALHGDPLYEILGHGMKMDVQVVQGAGTETVVQVQPVMDATGDADVLLQWAPEPDVDMIEVYLRDLDGDWPFDPEFTLSGNDLSLGQYALGFPNLSAGSHVIGVYFYNQDYLVSTALEVINVYGNHRTVGEIVLDEADFLSPP